MKNYKTVNQLLEHLEKDRHLILEEDSKNIFNFYRYGQVIDPYKDIMSKNILTGNVHIYEDGVTLNSFLSLMNVDEYISTKLTVYISHYEKMLKQFISEVVCNSMIKNGSSDCSDYSCFESIKQDDFSSPLDCFIPLNNEYDKKADLMLRETATYDARIRVIDKIIGFSQGRNTSELNYYVSDYYKSKRSIPFYILIGSLSFSNLIVLFEMFKKEIQFDFMKNQIGKTYIENKDIRALKGKHSVIRTIRNIIHHHEPLLPFLVRQEFLDFDTKKTSIRMLKNLYESSEGLNKIQISSDVDISIFKKLNNKKARKLAEIIDLIEK